MRWVVDFNTEKSDIYVGRPSKWSNPFRIGIDGTRDEVLLMYENYLYAHSKLIEEICRDLRGRILSCHCAGKSVAFVCHGDLLARIANGAQLCLPLIG